MRKTHADSFFGINWDNDATFYIYMQGERAVVMGKPQGNVYIQRVEVQG